jgi:hypothetical protein
MLPMPFLFLIGRFLKIFFSVTAQPNEPKLGGKHLWKVLYSVSSKQNERWATQAQWGSTSVAVKWVVHLSFCFEKT